MKSDTLNDEALKSDTLNDEALMSESAKFPVIDRRSSALERDYRRREEQRWRLDRNENVMRSNAQ